MTKQCIWTGRTEDYFTFRYVPEGETDSRSREVSVSEVANPDIRREGVRRLVADAVAAGAPDIRMGVYHVAADKALGVIIPLGLHPGDVEMIIRNNIAESLKGVPESEAA